MLFLQQYNCFFVHKSIQFTTDQYFNKAKYANYIDKHYNNVEVILYLCFMMIFVSYYCVKGLKIVFLYQDKLISSIISVARRKASC